MELIWGIGSMFVLLLALACGVLFLFKVGIKRVSIYFFFSLLSLGILIGSAGVIILISPGGEGLRGLLFRAADTLLPLAGTVLPFFFFQVSLLYGRAGSEPNNPGVGIFMKTAGFVTIIAAFFILSGLLQVSLVTESGYVLVMQDFLSRVIGIIMSVLMIYTFVNFENTWRAASGAVKKQLFLLMVVDLLILAGLIRVVFLGSVTLTYIGIFTPIIFVLLCWLYFLLLRKDAYSSNVVLDRQAFYSSVLILFLGLFLLFTGLVGKIIMILGGRIEAFLSLLGVFLVIGIFLLVILSGSVRTRFNRIVQERVYAGRFDYKAEWRAISENFAACDSLETLYSILSREIQRLLNPLKFEIFITDDTALRCVYPVNGETNEYSMKDPAIEWLFYNTEPAKPSQIRISDPSRLVEKVEQFGVLVPLVAEKKLVGLVFLGYKQGKTEYNNEEFAMLSAMGHQAAVAVLHLRSRNKLLENEKLASFHRTASFVVHDLKNAVSMLSLMLQNAPQKMSNPEFQKESLKTISQAVNRMQKIIEKLKSPPKKDQLQVYDIKPVKILEKAIEKSGIKNKPGIELIVNIDDSLKVKTDPQVLETVFVNLLINAVEAMPEGGTIRVDEYMINDNINISITDTGVGMSESFIKNKLFRPFQTTKTKGLGIGLYQCREMFRETGGDIIAQSEPGKGSKFRLIF